MVVVDHQIEMFEKAVTQDPADARIGGTKVGDIAKDRLGISNRAIAGLEKLYMGELAP